MQPTPPEPPRLGLAWTPEQAAAAVHPHGDPVLLRAVMALLHLPPVAEGRWDAADLLGVHVALAPWLRRRILPVGDPVGEEAASDPEPAPASAAA